MVSAILSDGFCRFLGCVHAVIMFGFLFLVLSANVSAVFTVVLSDDLLIILILVYCVSTVLLDVFLSYMCFLLCCNL